MWVWPSRDMPFISPPSSIQWVGGAAVFLLPCSPTPLRKLLKPLHVWFGGSILSLAIVACISGINEKLFFALWVSKFCVYLRLHWRTSHDFITVVLHSKGDANGTLPYSSLPPEAVFGNSLGVVIVVFGLVVLKMLSNPRWQRPDAAPAETSYSVSISAPMTHVKGFTLIKLFHERHLLVHSRCFKKKTNEVNFKHKQLSRRSRPEESL